MKLYRAFATVGGLTMASRVLGFARDILIAAVLGTGWVADAFFVAFRFPNLFRRLFGEGAFNSAFVPLFAKRLEGEGPEAAKSFAEEALAGLLFVLLLLTALAEVAMPWLMYVLAPGFGGTADKVVLAVLLMLCVLLVALLSWALNVLGRFSMAAAVLLSVVLIGAMLLAGWIGLQNSPEAWFVLSWWTAAMQSPASGGTPEKFDLAVLLTRIAFPYLLCMSLVALLSGALNALGRFSMAAAAPILLNVVLIGAMLLAAWLGLHNSPEAGIILSWGVAVAGVVQLGALWIAVRRAGLHVRITRPRLSPDMRQLVRLGVPGLISGGVTQLNIVVGTIIASLQAGAVSYLYYADRLYQLPLGIVGVAIGVVLLPDLARNLRAGDHRSVMDNQNRSVEFALLLTLPAAVALAVAADPIIRVLFERGAFKAADTLPTAAALAAFSFGLPAFVLIKVLQPAFFAREDTRTPMRYAVWNMVLNVVGSIALFFLFQALGWIPHLGIAIATTLSAWANVYMLWATLSRRGHFAWDDRLRRNLAMIGLSSTVTGCVVWATTLLAGPYLEASAGVGSRVGALGLVLTAGLVVYALAVQATGVIRWGDFLQRLVARRQREA
jgi:putative peptidoglycan lipid II flippase